MRVGGVRSPAPVLGNGADHRPDSGLSPIIPFMLTDWEIVETGPPEATRTVLLLPGGMCSARSYAEVMAEPSLASLRLVAATLPGHAGAAPPQNFSTEDYARITAELAREIKADVVVGFSMGAMVAYEMAVSSAFAGPLVLLGASLSSADEPAS